MLKILNIVGARPNFMKIAPLIKEMSSHKEIEQKLVHTGQHYDPNLSDVFFTELGIPRPDVSLGIGSFPREEQIKKIAEAFEPVLIEHKPNLVLVVGDVNSTIACAEVARRHNVKVAHVEAGLRSFDQGMPEELNRIATDKISDLLFVTEIAGIQNLQNENVPGKRYFVGNVMIDTLIQHLPRAKALNVPKRFQLEEKKYIVSTFHRPSNVDTPQALGNLIETIEMVTSLAEMVLPLHPRTLSTITRFGLLSKLQSIKGLRLIEPLGYLEFIGLVASSLAVITDSGGIQEETTYLQVPCLTMRENTERPVTVDVGTNVLVGSDRQALETELRAILAGIPKSGSIPPLWDGQASQRIVALLLQELNG